MACDEALADRVRLLLAPRTDVSERKMFGGLAFMAGDHMCCGIVGGELMVRVGPQRHPQALARPHVRPMNFTGRPMTGWSTSAPAACGASARCGHGSSRR